MEIYKGSPNLKGCGASWSFNANKDGKSHGIYLNLITQVSWDQKSRLPSFKGGKESTVKFAAHEAALICRVLSGQKSIKDYNGGSDLFHTTKDTNSTIGLSFYSVDKERDGKNTTSYGYAFNITKKNKSDSSENVSYALRLTVGEAEELKIWLASAIKAIHSAKLAIKNEKYSKEK